MRERSTHSNLTIFLVTAAAFVVLVAGMKAAQSLLVPFFLSVFVAVIASPSLFYLKRKGCPSVLAVTLLVLVIVLAVSMVGALVGTSVNDFVRTLPEYQQRLQNSFAVHLSWLENRGVELPKEMMLDYFDPGAAMRLTGRVLSEVSGIFGNFFLILLTTIFMLAEASSMPGKIEAALGKKKASSGALKEFTASVNRYMGLKTIVSFATGLLATTLLWIVGVDYPVMWGVLAFFLNFVPNLGSIIAAIPAVLLAMIQLGFGSAVIVAVGYLLINLIMGNVVEPRYMGRGLGLSTLVVFLSLVFWGWLLGPVGMLLSVPLTMTVKIALESSEDTRWIAVPLGTEKEVIKAAKK